MATKKKAVKVKDPKAKYYSISRDGSWIPVEKGFGGKLSEVNSLDFKYPIDQMSSGSILFDDGTIVDRINKTARRSNWLSVVEALDKSQKSKTK